jgi:hypothetical protein
VREKRQLPILSILEAGNPDFERWAIADERSRFWTGEEFDYCGYRLYASYNSAASATQEILRSHFAGVKPVFFKTPLFVEVLAEDPVEAAMVSLHLSQALRLYMNTPEHGHGPDGNLILPWVDWSEIKPCHDPYDLDQLP